MEKFFALVKYSLHCKLLKISDRNYDARNKIFQPYSFFFLQNHHTQYKNCSTTGYSDVLSYRYIDCWIFIKCFLVSANSRI